MKGGPAVPNKELDVGLCVSSGQVFRWRQTASGFIGVDGPNVMEARKGRGGWVLESRPDPDAATRLFQLDRSLEPITQEIIRRGPELKPFIEAYPGLRVLRPKRADETLFSFLCTTNNNLARITRMVETLAGYGKRIEDGRFEFPIAERLAEVGEAELRGKGFGYRGRTISRAAAQVATRGSSWLDSLKGLPYDEARSALCELDGVGLKVADCVCLVGFGFETAVPVDTHLWRAACDLYFPEWEGKSLTEKRYLAVGDLFRDRFGEVAGWAHQYLFYHRVLAYRGGKAPVYYEQ
ncbi:MAG: hypothetical protein IH851_04005 [Armatimonadetes bacterium]|nr:hypothetical protein [Armatimonadota bacterium]